MAPDFMLYVADTRNDLVRCFTPFGKEVARVGLPHTRSPGAANRDRTGNLGSPVFRNYRTWRSSGIQKWNR